MAKLTVVIPYYQKEPGILRRALASVFAQTLEDFHVLVIDDESPYPIADELAGLAQEERERITVIRQPNGGPGGARNTGLDNVPADSDFVAFLDSDDVWTPDHLLNAYQSMTRFDADCYWASITGGDAFYYHFGVADLEKSETVTRLSENPLVVELPELQDVMLKNWSFLHMSCMVIGRKLFEKGAFRGHAQACGRGCALLLRLRARIQARGALRCSGRGAWRRAQHLSFDR
ncbi:glycosyltransferase involved in cell wall biosynthesis [Sinorhizobium meliloti]